MAGKLKDYMEGKLGTLYLELTSRCNFLCKYCYNDSSIKSHFILPTERIIDTLSLAKAKLGLHTVIFSGGEPMMHPDFVLLCRKASEIGCKIIIYTNGSLITDELIKSIAPFYPDFQITLDAPLKEINDSYKGKGSFEAITRGIDVLNKLYDMDHIVIRCNLTYEMLRSYDMVIEHINSLEKRGVKKAYFSLIEEKGRADKNTYPSMENDLHELMDFREKVLGLAVRTTMNVDFPFESCYSCPYVEVEDYAGEYTLHVASDGSVFPCSGLSYTKHVIGNILSSNIESIYYGDLMEMFVKDAVKTRDSIAACQKCSFRHICKKGCISEMEADTRLFEIICKRRRKEMVRIIRQNTGVN